MAKTELKLTSKAQASGKKITTTLNYVNPLANSTTLKQFATKLNGFTTNVYEETNRVQTINVDTEQVPVDENAKLTPTVTRTTPAEQRWDQNTNSFVIEYDVEAEGNFSIGYTINEDKGYYRDNFYVQYTQTKTAEKHFHLVIGLYAKTTLTYNGQIGLLFFWTPPSDNYKALRTYTFIQAPST